MQRLVLLTALQWLKRPVHDLCYLLQHGSSQERYEVVIRFFIAPAIADTTIPSLIRALNDSNEDIRYAVKQSLRYLLLKRHDDMEFADFERCFLLSAYDPAERASSNWPLCIISHPWHSAMLMHEASKYIGIDHIELRDTAQTNLTMKLLQNPTLDFNPERINESHGWIRRAMIRNPLYDAYRYSVGPRRHRRKSKGAVESTGIPAQYPSEIQLVEHTDKGLNDLADWRETDPANVVERMDEADQLNFLLKMLRMNGLPRQVLRLHGLHGHTYLAIATDLGLKPHQVKYAWQCATKSLKRHLRG